MHLIVVVRPGDLLLDRWMVAKTVERRGRKKEQDVARWRVENRRNTSSVTWSTPHWSMKSSLAACVLASVGPHLASASSGLHITAILYRRKQLVAPGRPWYFRAVKPVRFGPHALKKFDDLARYNFIVTREQVEGTVRQPDRVEPGRKGRQVATRGLNERLMLRVVYRETDDAYEIVTFYPGRRSRYENPVRQG
jgi:hypothetical protein